MRFRSTLILGLALGPGCFGGKKPPATAAEPEVAAPPEAGTDEAAAAQAPETWTPQRVHDEVGRAAALLTSRQEADARQALEILREVARQAPDDAYVAYNQGVAYMVLGDSTAARKAFLHATEIDPTLGEAWQNLGALAEREGDYARALRNYEAGLKHDPDNGDLVVGVIGALRKMGRGDEAIARAKEALREHANNINVYNNLGLVYIDQGKVDLALFIYQRALQFIDGADNNALIHANLGRVYLLQDKTALARAEFERALELDPNLVPALMFLAQLYMDKRDWESASGLLERARALEPDNAAILVNLGICYRGLGRFEDARRAYDKALDVNPDFLETYLDLAVLLGDSMKAYDQAIEQIQKYLQLGGTHTDVAQAWLADLQKEKERARKAAERKKRQEEARRKREERERLLREAQEKEAREQEAAGSTEATPATGSGTAGEAGGAAGSPWGNQGASAPAEAAPAEASPAAATGEAAGQSCSAVGACGDLSLECSHDGVCRPAGTQGTYGMGVGCMVDTDCAFGLSCVQNLCSAAPAGTDPAGGGQ